MLSGYLLPRYVSAPRGCEKAFGFDGLTLTDWLVDGLKLGFTTLPETKPDFLPATAEVMDAVVEGADVDMEGASSPPPSDLETTAASGSAAAGSSAPLNPKDEQLLRDLHRLLLETQVREGKMVCGNCGFEYKIKEGIPNFLLPSHLV